MGLGVGLVRGVPWVRGAAGLVGAIAAAGAVATWATYRRRGPGVAWLGMAAGTFLALEAAAGAVLMPALNPVKTPQAIVADVQRWVPEGQPLLVFRINGEIHPLYCQRPAIRIDSTGQLGRTMKEQGRGAIVDGGGTWDTLQRFRRYVGEERKFRLGSKRLVWVGFEAPRRRAPGGGTR